MSELAMDPLAIDAAAEADRIEAALREALSKRLRRRGVVLGISGGVDSAVCAALCARALGPEKVFGLLMPEADSSPESTHRGRLVAEQLGIRCLEEDVTPALEAVGCYRWRDEAIQEVCPGYDGGWPHKLAIRGGHAGYVNHFVLVVERPGGREEEVRLPLNVYLQIVAATNFKQRVRKMLEYFHADRLNYGVIGTPNRLEYDQGFFVKNGDGAADFKPIAHLYKTQVYALGAYLGIPEEIQTAVPTTDTFSLEQGQEEFYFTLPYHQMDLALWAYNNGVPVEAVSERLGIDRESAEHVFQDIGRKRRTTAYQHLGGLLVEPIPEIGDPARPTGART